MEPSTNTAAPLTTTPDSSSSPLAALSDTELLTATRWLVGRSNQLLASLLAHLAEVEARGIHRARACASLYTYCIYELRFSEDEAFRRVAAARLVGRFPVLLDALAAGELHLTGLLMLGPHLTADNLLEVLALAKHRTKKELARLVRRLDPLPEVPSRIEPLGPASSRLFSPAPSWTQSLSALNPIRELDPSARPRDWTAWKQSDASANDSESGGANDHGGLTPQPALARVDTVGSKPEPALTRLEPQRYKVQFEASEEYVELVEKATALLSHVAPRLDLADLHLRAMRGLVAELERAKYAPTTRSRRRTEGGSIETMNSEGHRGGAAPREQLGSNETERATESQHPRQRGRHIPAAIRRAVLERDAGRCTYRSDSGERCRETARLELHHSVAFAQGGKHRLDNVTLRCHAHNSLAAEQDFGRDFVTCARESSQHELWFKHGGPRATPRASSVANEPLESPAPRSLACGSARRR